MANKNEWLPHLENAIPKSAYGKRLSMYTIALEAWRRGIKVNFYRLEDPDNKLRIRYSLSYGGREHKFESSRGDLLTDEAYDICDNKDLTKQQLANAEIPVPKGKRFETDVDDEEIMTYAHNLGYPVVLKPINENAGKGVMANIRDEKELKDALVHVRGELNYWDVIVEEYVQGNEFRIFVIGNQVIGAVNRIPANIVGDGTSSIEKLIKMKNESKKGNPTLAKNPIHIDKEVLNNLYANNYTLDSIPDAEKCIFLRNKSSVSMGGEPIDVTDKLTSKMQDLAMKACQAIPGLDLCGLDMIIDQENDSGTIIEINTKPMLGLHLFPEKGQSRDVTLKIIDYYFPETIDIKRTCLYFDLDSVLEPLKNRSVNEIKLTSPPTGELYTKRYIVNGDVQGVGYRKWIRKQALQHHLHGYTQNKQSGNVVVVVAGTNQEDVNTFKRICYQGPDHAQVEKVKEKDYEKPVKMGFEIKKESKENSLNKLKAQLQQEKANLEKMEQKITKLEHENHLAQQKLENVQQQKEQIEQAYTMLKNSRSWRYTKPLRSMGNLTKRS